MMNEEMKKKFVKDFNIPINIFEEPYFSKRMELLDKTHNTKELFSLFEKTLAMYDSEQDFMEEFHKIVDSAVEYITSNEVYRTEFNVCDMKPYAVNYNFPSATIFKEHNVGKQLISIDMKKANFTTLKYFGVLKDFDTYEDFIRMFTDKEYFVRSKKIREIIFGKTNSGRLGTFEKFLMKKVLLKIDECGYLDKVIFYSNDEIIIDITTIDDKDKIRRDVQEFVEELKEEKLTFHVEEYTLKRILPISSYVKVFTDGTFSIKATNAIYIPLVTRFLKGEEPDETDSVFPYEGEKATFVDIKKLRLVDKL